MPAKLHDALLHHLVVACVLCKPVLLWQWLRMARAMTSLACLTDETKLHIVSYCSALFSTRDNGIAVANRLWNVMWRRMLRPLLPLMFLEIFNQATEDACPHILGMLDFADAAGLNYQSVLKRRNDLFMLDGSQREPLMIS